MTPFSDPTGGPIKTRGARRLAVGIVLAGSLLVAACGTGSTTSPTPSSAPSSSPAIAGALQADFINVVGRISPSVVVIETPSGLGSGIVFDAKGDIVTNDHVVTGSTTFTVTLADGTKLPGTL
ncbi:MAG: putative serine protease PepD, partial [Acidimicrobiaceae bacterium]